MDVNVLNPQGELVSLPQEQVADALQAGYQQASAEDVEKYKNQQKYGGVGQQIITGLEGAGEGATFGLSTALERAAGVLNKDIRGRREENPISHTTGQVLGVAGSSFLPGAGEAELAETGAKALETGANAAEMGSRVINPLSAQSVMSGLGEKAVQSLGLAPESIAGTGTKFAVENALFQSGDELSKMISEDPHTTVESAIANVGLAGLLGFGGGAGIAAVSPLWKAASESKVAQFISDAKGRWAEHLDNPDRLPSMADELAHRLKTSDEVFDETYGAKGVKAQAISKLLPSQLSDHMVAQAQDTLQVANNFIKEMQAEPDLFPRGLAAKFEKEARVLGDSIGELKSPEQVFNSLQRFKQALQEQFPKRWESVPLEAKDYLKTAGSLAKELRIGLEDPEVWGKAGQVQQDINKAFSEWLPFKKQFESKFMDKIGEDKQLSLGKLQTFLNQTGKAAQDTKQKILGGFLDADEAYRNAIKSSYEKMGEASPFVEAPLNYSNAELRKLTSGQKFADVFLKKGLSKVIGGGVGGAIGGLAGHPFLGAIAGEHALSPLIDSVLPSLIKPILQNEASGAGLKSAVNLSMAAAKGQKLLGQAAKSIFSASASILPAKAANLAKLDERLKALQENPGSLADMGGHVSHYMPDHAAVMAEAGARAVSTLNSLRPPTTQAAPLDTPSTPTAAQKAAYNELLEIAQSPLLLTEKIKKGTLSSSHLIALKTLYPALYGSMVNKISHEMTSHISKGGTIPYKTRMGLSLFMGQPLDSTMTPQAIQAHQLGNKTDLAPSQQGMKPKPSSPALQKMASSFMTAGQQAESRRLK